MIVKKLAGLALAGLMAVSAVSIPVNAAGEGRTANECTTHSMVQYDERKTYGDPGPTYHSVMVTYYYKCVYCTHTETYGNSYQEDHDYVFNGSTFEYVCWKCGDITK